MDKDELIRLRAYEIWIQEGQPEGHEHEHWLQARRDIEGQFPEDEAGNELAPAKKRVRSTKR